MAFSHARNLPTKGEDARPPLACTRLIRDFITEERRWREYAFRDQPLKQRSKLRDCDIVLECLAELEEAIANGIPAQTKQLTLVGKESSVQAGIVQGEEREMRVAIIAELIDKLDSLLDQLEDANLGIAYGPAHKAGCQFKYELEDMLFAAEGAEQLALSEAPVDDDWSPFDEDAVERDMHDRAIRRG